MPFSRERDLSKLEQEVFDLLVIGGGITGATVAWDATLRGLKVLLVERSDFGSATTSASSKLIHGGLRYLKNAEIGLVRESLRERRYFQTIAPHLVRPLPFLIPTYRSGGNRRMLIKAGMMMYDALSFDRANISDPERRIPRHQMLSADRVLDLEPQVNPQGLTGGAVYYDCQCEPERLCLEFILAAAQRGASVHNYLEVNELTCRSGRIDQVGLIDRLSNKSIAVHARAVANVTGPWADTIDALCGVLDQVVLKRSKGIHLVTRSLSRNHAVVLQTPSGRHFFIIPWYGLSLIGTTDTEYQGSLADLSATEEDVVQFLAEINAVCPSAHLQPDDVQFQYAGVRPLVEQETQVYQASRKYEIVDHRHRGVSGYFTAIGGKYTTSRNLARKLVDRILTRLGHPQVDCLTAKTLLPGGMPGSFSAYQQTSLKAAGALLPADVLQHLISIYGARHDQVLERVRQNPQLAERVTADRPEILAEIDQALEAEWACTATDVLFRRTAIGLCGHPGDAGLERALNFIAARLGWDGARRATERQACLTRLSGSSEAALGIGRR
jgi:glycerol-3-phosphate dehydrogenase